MTHRNSALPASRVAAAITPGGANPALTRTAGFTRRSLPSGDKPHRHVFTLYALAVEKLEVAGGVFTTGSTGRCGAVLNKRMGAALLGNASFAAAYGG